MRTVRHRKPENFLRAVERNGHGMREEVRLTPGEAADEALVMGLRLSEGIDADAIARRFGFDEIVDWIKVDRLVGSGHLARKEGRISLTPGGRLLLDRILAEISADLPNLTSTGPLVSAAA
jgi:oxygen-independent coproporphyrinogen-3 oxidase